MTIEGKSLLVVLSLLVISSVKIHRITRNELSKDLASNQFVFNFETSISGAQAMAMQFSMQMPMGMSGFPPAVNLPNYHFLSGHAPDKMFIQALPDGGPLRQTIPLRYQQSRRSISQQYQPPTQPSSCQCGHQQQQIHTMPTSTCTPCPHRPPQQPPQVQQRPCCPDAPQPITNCPPCPHNGPNQHQPGPSLVPIAQIILSPRDKYDEESGSETNEDSRDGSSDENDDCVDRCKKKVARLNAGYRRINKRKKSHSRRTEHGTENEIKYKPLRPVLSYIGSNGDVKYETKITNDDTLDLIDDFSHIDLKRHKRLTGNTAFLFEDEMNVPRKMAMMRAQDDIINVEDSMIPGKHFHFQSPTKNEMANMSFTFLLT